MSEEFLADIANKIDVADKLLRWQIALFALIIAGAVWGTTTNLRLSSIESDRAVRIPRMEEWKRTTDIELANHDARLSGLEGRR